MKILLTGASGLLGRSVYRELKSCGKGFEVTGTAFSRTDGDLVKLDLLDSSAVKKFISDFKPDLIVHSAAERRPDEVKANPEKAQRVNVDATGFIAEAAEACGAFILYMSTNYVFDGKNPPYYPESVTNPLNDYGRMKLEGEKIVADRCSNAIILRIPILYGRCEYLGESAVTLIADGINPDRPFYIDNRMTRFPTHADDVAAVITGLAGLIQDGEKISGIYQWSTETPYTKYSLAKIMAGILRVNPDLILEAEPDLNAAPRPQNAKLDTGRLKELGFFYNRDFKKAVREIIQEHR